jgi:hypothetical protein
VDRNESEERRPEDRNWSIVIRRQGSAISNKRTRIRGRGPEADDRSEDSDKKKQGSHNRGPMTGIW